MTTTTMTTRNSLLIAPSVIAPLAAVAAFTDIIQNAVEIFLWRIDNCIMSKYDNDNADEVRGGGGGVAEMSRESVERVKMLAEKASGGISNTNREVVGKERAEASEQALKEAKAELDRVVLVASETVTHVYDTATSASRDGIVNSERTARSAIETASGAYTEASGGAVLLKEGVSDRIENATRALDDTTEGANRAVRDAYEYANTRAANVRTRAREEAERISCAVETFLISDLGEHHASLLADNGRGRVGK